MGMLAPNRLGEDESLPEALGEDRQGDGDSGVVPHNRLDRELNRHLCYRHLVNCRPPTNVPKWRL
jgi:hypothetical protein